MIKTLSKAQKMEREEFRIPRSVQDAIPIRRIFADGIFQVGNQYSKTWSFTDINYAIASKEDKTSMFLAYSELLNALDSGASAKITIYNRRINKTEFERSVLLPDKDDGLDEYRHEFNQMLTAQVTGTSNSIVRERYLTVSVVKRNADEARSYFARVGTDLVTHLAQLSSVASELTLNERLHIFRDFFKAGEQAAAEFNIHKHAKRGQHFKDWFCPDSMEFAADHFKLDSRYGRVLYLQDYANYIKDSFVSELCDLDRDLMLSIDILPVPTDEAARQLQSTLLGVETNVANWQRRQNANNNFTATIPYDMELQRKETKEMLDDLTTRDQRMMFGLVTLVHLADSKEQLDSDTETLYSTARRHLCQLSTLR
uniref:VirB4-like conjugal transfer ATPase, CD1110 family n=1 Tax=Gemmiger formicilis TaxID=745368 RepID=UPI00402556ED